ncbi:REP element-mobilizing transposase RayT [Salirhabdus euzebyi]|uniref:REP element-mobilizing transposase RayT n=1 Tax=Salirhabdus euzebyi TaxID=394506 RepID=A0A841Q5C5_9BACI|nr:transposase [Salirhabdus euzebyi]MBB6453669.1 REP element-mobilizing transposase RayT [Salirhabdus euzebyi]
MGRKLRTWIPEYFYHIVCRGIRRDALFKDTHDFQTFLYILQKVHENTPFEIASYCLMTNHFHLQLRSKEQPISKVMALINKRYANYYNTKYNLTGHVFEKRYFDDMIKTEIGMLEVSRYIHLNPLKAKIVNRLGDYQWSSYPYFLLRGKTIIPNYMKVDLLLSTFDSHQNVFSSYNDFIENFDGDKDLLNRILLSKVNS